MQSGKQTTNKQRSKQTKPIMDPLNVTISPKRTKSVARRNWDVTHDAKEALQMPLFKHVFLCNEAIGRDMK